MTSQLVLITGASGHLGFRTLVLALRQGYQVICTVRQEEQTKNIAIQPSILPYAHNLSFALVKDITAPHAFDEAMKEVTHVIHIASPIASRVPQSAGGEYPPWEEHFYDPARKGTLTLLESASATPSVRRVIVTSSVVVLQRDKPEPGAGRKLLTVPIKEAKCVTDDLQAYDIQDIPSEESYKNPPNVFEAYANSKVIAYHAATDFVQERKPAFDLIRVSPGYIKGANELNETGEDVQKGSNSAIMGVALGQITEGPKLTAQVLLEDVARAHVLALNPKIAPNLANLLIAGHGGRGSSWAQVAELIERIYPDEVEAGILKPTNGQQDWLTLFDVRSSQEALGFQFAGIEEMIRSVVDQYLQLRRHDS